jgi:hypothetical protein
MFEFTNDLVDILGKIQAGKCDTIDFYRRAFEFMWGAKLSTVQRNDDRKHICDVENELF